MAALSGLAAGVLLLAAVPLAGTAQAATGTVVYASPAGSGSECTITAPCSLDGAQNAVRSANGSMTADITVYLRGGTYHRTSPLALGPQDSGTGGHNVNWVAYPGEVPVLSGGQQVTGFSAYDSSKNIWRASVPVGTQSRELFVNGVRAQRARGPLNPQGFDLSGSSFTTSDPSYASFTDQSRIEVVANREWKHMRCPLKSITATDSGGSSLNVNADCFKNNNSSVPNPGFPFNGSGLPKLDGISWIENAYQLLTQPGQFYLDSDAGYLYYIPRAGENLAGADVQLPTAAELLDLSGTPGHIAPVNDDDPDAVYTGSWTALGDRGSFGDLYGDVHATSTDGDSVSYTFTGTGVQVLTEKHPDGGDIDVYVDGTKTRTVSAASAAGSRRLAQQPLVDVSGLSKGTHTVKLVKAGGSEMLVDGFSVIPDTVQPVHNITFQGVTFAYNTWNQPTTTGYVDNQAGVLWNTATKYPTPTRIPGAVQVHRGNAIAFTRNTFTHLGSTALDLADGTQNSAVTGNIITDTSGGGVSLGEADDYYQTRPELMTTGDTITDNTITYVGQQYQDTIGVWAGYTQNVTIAENDIGYMPYSGISLGWGWGWATHYGTNYAGDNRITGNSLHNVMLLLRDGGPVYLNGGQGNSGSGTNASTTTTSVISGNYLAVASHACCSVYLDEGSSWWDVHDNVMRFIAPSSWVGVQSDGSVHDTTVKSNYSDTSLSENGKGATVEPATVVTDGAWPAPAQAIITAAGPRAQYRPLTGRIDDDDPGISYSGGSWGYSSNRGLGDFNDGIHVATTDGDAAGYTFTGTGIQVLGEKGADQGLVTVYLDGVSQGQVDTHADTRQVQQVVWSTSGLTPGSHTVKVVKSSGAFATLDGFQVTRTVNDDHPSLQYTGSSWQASTGRGFGDHGDDVHAATADGDAVTVTFYGTGIDYLTETNTDQGTVSVSLDGTSQGSRNAYSATRAAQQNLYSAGGLTLGHHTLTLTKAGGGYLLVDRFDIR
ncbi:hypothetical protein [Streptomyces sp. NRRL WC-3742]|uniref:hypothetical protein n=1 Tax=Streptomyces sp. NRRL WC-3742 TaxID=1463934 RepID=UPI00131AEEAA|nr:hypothetical protein [Streptomyces sp. NRRL WC-3742]